MTRVLFEAKRRLPAPDARTGVIVVEPPPELPRLIPPSLLRRAMPWVIGALVVGMVVALFATGMRLITPQTLFFPFVLLLAATGIFRGSGSGTPVAEVDAERADYLRYLSRVRSEARTAANAQRAALEWSHPAPTGLAAVAGTRRQWERDPGDADFLVVRVGLGDVPAAAALRVGESGDEADLEPVCQTSLAALIEAHRDLAHAPVTIDLAAIREIVVHGPADEVREALSAWIANATCWHDPAVLAVAALSPHIDSPAWTWLKWLPHTDIPGKADGLGPARRLTADASALPGLVADVLQGRPPRGGGPAALGHVLIVVDDPAWRPDAVLPPEGYAGVVLIRRAEEEPGLDEEVDHARLVLKVENGSLQQYKHGVWRDYAARADTLEPSEAAHLARQLGRWDSGPVAVDSRVSSTHGSGFPALLGIEDPADLDVTSLWSRRSRDRELRVPIGVTSTGEPLMFDLKDEAEGGMGPHGLMIGMTGSGKSQTIMAILLSLLTTHPADRLIVIYLDFKGEAGADIFREFPQVVAVISNMAEKRSLADRFSDTLRGEIARREQQLREAGRQVQGSAFNSVAEYENAIAHGHDLPPIPTLFIVADEFTLMLADHPEYAELFDHVARKGRSLRVHILFASQTLDIGRIKDIDKNTSYRIGLKVASPASSRQVIGVEDAYHIESGKEHKGVGYFVPSPGAMPIKFRASYVDGVYEPPRAIAAAKPYASAEPKRFTAAWAAPDQPETEEAPDGPAPIAKARKLIAVIGEQLAELGPKAPELWLAPLDTPVSLGGLLRRVGANAPSLRPLCWPVGEIDRPFLMRRDPLVFDAASAAGNIVIHGGPKSGKSSGLMTVVLSAAAACSPEDVQFHILDYGGGRHSALAPLAHVSAVASPHDDELVRRILAELRQLLAARRRLFRDHEVASIEQFRQRRKTEPALADGFGDVFLLLDDLSAFSRANTDQFTTKNPLLAEVSELANSGLAYGIHVLVTTANWIDVPLAMRDGLGLRLELRLTDPRDSNVRDPEALRKPAEFVPADQPGRGLTPSAEHFLFAAPRLDEEDTDAGLTAATAASVRLLNDRYPGVGAPRVRVLPASLDPADLEPVLPEPDLLVIGRREEDLAPAAVDFAANPLLLVLGDSASGKTTLLRHIIRSVRDNSTADQVAFTVVDRRLRLVDEPLFADNEHTTHLDRVIPAMLGLTALLEQRRPPAGLSAQQLRSWSFPVTASDPGQTHYLLIDDADQIPDAPAFSGPYIGQRPWSGIISLLASAADLGLRVIVTARAAGSGHTVMTNSLLRALVDLQANTLMLSGNPHDSGKIRGHRFSRLPPGRAVLVGDDDVPAFIQLANAQSAEKRKEGRR
ncbi:cell division FtsK/SpoIIIE [Segniliparus rotundus DSM 44985]|uniref:Cell division FtsK/SpoIIIE n=1 Tax=Segniliparus rotundus (strain ATCC BAA-972 / CDC 1076 / CIP 108378 / DSM 44985 / JCM 13578) TaxID=640132 RepID=D6ZDF9_SEGRD|nr:type VII secretion protein EccC [Segniliparus rotundus]ADG97223.1 cell division FtsK/SpoIIIE [Segniliparus rotundus DSM 44985]